MIYLDYAATSPMNEHALQAYVEAARTVYGNSASLHDAGGVAAHYVEQARKIVADKLGVIKDGIVFTSSGTEGNIVAILTVAKSVPTKKHMITFQAEHTSVHAAMNTLQQQGYAIDRLPLLPCGTIDLALVERTITRETALIAIQHVNSEIGAIFPIEEIAALAKRYGVLVHVDCVQSFGKLDVTTFAPHVASMTVSAHKIGGPKGCGAIYINPFLPLRPLTPGVTHERGLRGGTLDVPSIIAFATALQHYTYDIDYCRQLRQHFAAHLPASYELVQCTHQLPSICSLISKGYEGQYVLLKCNDAAIAISTGSACDIRNESGTKAIQAMGHSVATARKFFRISFASSTQQRELDACIGVLTQLNEQNL